MNVRLIHLRHVCNVLITKRSTSNIFYCRNNNHEIQTLYSSWLQLLQFLRTFFSLKYENIFPSSIEHGISLQNPTRATVSVFFTFLLVISLSFWLDTLLPFSIVTLLSISTAITRQHYILFSCYIQFHQSSFCSFLISFVMHFQFLLQNKKIRRKKV